MNKKLTIISSTFAKGYGIIVRDENWNMYHLLVVTDRTTQKPCIELHNKIYFKEDINK